MCKFHRNREKVIQQVSRECLFCSNVLLMFYDPSGHDARSLVWNGESAYCVYISSFVADASQMKSESIFMKCRLINKESINLFECFRD